MKTIKRLALLLLIIYKETPQIIKLYRDLYKNIIKKDDEIKQQFKQMELADRDINTTFVKGTEIKSKEIEERLKRQRRKVDSIYNEYKHRKVL